MCGRRRCRSHGEGIGSGWGFLCGVFESPVRTGLPWCAESLLGGTSRCWTLVVKKKWWWIGRFFVDVCFMCRVRDISVIVMWRSCDSKSERLNWLKFLFWCSFMKSKFVTPKADLYKTCPHQRVKCGICVWCFLVYFCGETCPKKLQHKDIKDITVSCLHTN